MHLTVIRSIHVFSLVNISDISIDCLRNVCVCVFTGVYFLYWLQIRSGKNLKIKPDCAYHLFSFADLSAAYNAFL